MRLNQVEWKNIEPDPEGWRFLWVYKPLLPKKEGEWYFFPSFLACCLTPKWEHDGIGSPAYWLLFPVLASVFTASLVEFLSSVRIWHSAALPRGAIEPWPLHISGMVRDPKAAGSATSLEGELRILILNNCSRGLFCFPLQLAVPKTVIKKEENPLLLLPISLLKIQHILGLEQKELGIFEACCLTSLQLWGIITAGKCSTWSGRAAKQLSRGCCQRTGRTGEARIRCLCWASSGPVAAKPSVHRKLAESHVRKSHMDGTSTANAAKTS